MYRGQEDGIMDELREVITLIGEVKESLGIVGAVGLVAAYRWIVSPVKKHYGDVQVWLNLYLEAHQADVYEAQGIRRELRRIADALSDCDV